jgi:hypothetical protein
MRLGVLLNRLLRIFVNTSEKVTGGSRKSYEEVHYYQGVQIKDEKGEACRTQGNPEGTKPLGWRGG